jgi:hypothetical protein
MHVQIEFLKMIIIEWIFYIPPLPLFPPPIPPAPTIPLKELWKTLTYEGSYFYVKYLQIEKNANMRAGRSV